MCTDCKPYPASASAAHWEERSHANTRGSTLLLSPNGCQLGSIAANNQCIRNDHDRQQAEVVLHHSVRGAEIIALDDCHHILRAVTRRRFPTEAVRQPSVVRCCRLRRHSRQQHKRCAACRLRHAQSAEGGLQRQRCAVRVRASFWTLQSEHAG